MNNVSDVIRQIQVVPKRIEDYSPEEIENFPKLFDWYVQVFESHHEKTLFLHMRKQRSI